MQGSRLNFPLFALVLAILTSCTTVGPIDQRGVTAMISDAVELNLSPTTEIDLYATWDPIKESYYSLLETAPVLQGLNPVEPTRHYGAESLNCFLPDHAVSVGDTWSINAVHVSEFLTQFHEGATAVLHNGAAANGAYACLRAYSTRWAEILIRAHAEIRLAKRDHYYMPAQFAGRLLLDRITGEVAAFQLGVPPRNPNVDVTLILNAEGLPENTLVADIGFVPRMELMGGSAAKLEATVWTESITEHEARELLKHCFYAFAKIEWLDFEQAVHKAQSSGMPLHVVTMFGSLDDESC